MYRSRNILAALSSHSTKDRSSEPLTGRHSASRGHTVYLLSGGPVLRHIAQQATGNGGNIEGCGSREHKQGGPPQQIVHFDREQPSEPAVIIEAVTFLVLGAWDVIGLTGKACA